MAEKLDWMNRIRACMEAKGASIPDSIRSSKDSVRSSKDSESSVTTRSTYDGPAVSKLGGLSSCLLVQDGHILVGIS